MILKSLNTVVLLLCCATFASFCFKSEIRLDNFQTGNNDIRPPVFKWKGMNIETFIKNNLVYPDSMVKNKIEALFMMQFTVDTSGKVSKIFTKDSIAAESMALYNEAVRVITLTSGKWNPATVNGVKKKMQMRIPIRFTLPD